MRKIKFMILVCILTGIISNSALAITLYVSPKGNDAAAGTIEKPLASLAGAQERIRTLRKTGKPENMEVLIANGDYYLKEPVLFTPQDGGSVSFSVTYKAQKDAKPIFYGGLPIKGFEKVNEKLWRVFIPQVQQFGWAFEQLYVNDARADRAKFPNAGFYQPDTVTETVIEKGKDRVANFAVQKIKLRAEQKKLFDSLNEADIENAVVTFYHKWDNTRKHIVSYSAKDSAFFVMGGGMKFWNLLDGKTNYTIENVKAGLDAPGEWFLEKTTGYLYYVPRPDEIMAATTAFAPVQDKFLVIVGDAKNRVQNLHFENLSFKVAGYTMPILGNNPMQGAAAIEATVMVDYANNIEFKNCEIAHIGSNAIWFRKACANSKVQQCYLHDLGAGGVKIGEIKLPPNAENTHHIIVDNNIIRSGGFVFPCAVGIMVFTGSDNELTHNEVADFRYSAISAGWVWGYGESAAKRNKIAYNHLHHLGWGVLSDMGGVYLLAPSEGTTVSNNVIHHIYSTTYGGWGLYTDEGSTGITMENNLVYACKSSAFHQHYGKDNIVRNNIFYNQLHAQLEASRLEPHIGFHFTNNIIYYSQGNLTGIRWDKCNFQSDSNAYWDTRTKEIKVVPTLSFADWQKTGKDVHSIIADPMFVDAAHLDFGIKNRSLLSSINFKPFDYTKAGVYGNEKWKALAVFDLKLTQQFDEMVAMHEKESVDHNAGL